MNDPSVEDLILQHGDIIMLDTLECVLWRNEHTKCFGCISEIGCLKLVTIDMLLLQNSLYEPKDFNDFRATHATLQGLIQTVLNAKTRKEINDVSMT